MTNKLRGEVEVKLGDQVFTMRPTFEAMAKIETQLNTSIPELIQQLSQGQLRFEMVGTIIWNGIVAANNGVAPYLDEEKKIRLRYADLCEMIFSEGLMPVLKQKMLMKFLVHGIAGDRAMETVEAQDENPPKEAS